METRLLCHAMLPIEDCLQPLLRRTVKLWSTELEQGPANLVTFRGHMFPVWDVAACPGGQYFASGSADRTARVWSTERAQSLRLLAGAALFLD